MRLGLFRLDLCMIRTSQISTISTPSPTASSSTTARWARTSSAINLTRGRFRRQVARGVQRPPRPHPARRHPGDPRVVPRGRLRRRRDLHLPDRRRTACEEWGLERQDARAQRAGRAARARRVRQVRDAGTPTLRRRLDRPDGHAPVEQRPGALEDHVRGARARPTTSRRSTWSKAASTCCSSRRRRTFSR